MDPLVSEEKVMFGLHAHATSVLTMIKIRKYFRKWDARAIAREVRGTGLILMCHRPRKPHLDMQVTVRFFVSYN